MADKKNKLIKIEIEEKDGKLVVSSRTIARELGKQHKHILETLDKILESRDFGSLIIPSTYKIEGQKRSYKEYLLTKDGFTLYMFNVQGYQEFKMKYINEFNERGRIIEELKKEKTEKISIKDKCLLNIINAKSETETALAIRDYEISYVKPLEIENKKQKDYIDHVVINEKYYIIPKQIGAKFNMTANLLNKVLNGLGIIYRVGKKWCLTRDYLGIADYNYFQKPNGEWEKGTSLHYLNEGEKLIFDILVANGYEPIKAGYLNE